MHTRSFFQLEVFFSTILKKVEHPSPCIYLKGMDKVDFLYNYEVNLPQGDLKGFLQTAKGLQVKGLQNSQGIESDGIKELFIGLEEGPNEKYEERNPHFLEEESILESVDKSSDDENIWEGNNIVESTDNVIDSLWEKERISKQENISNIDNNADVDNRDLTLANTSKESVVIGSNRELNLKVEQIVERDGVVWKCKVCGKTAKFKGHIKGHAERHIDGLIFNCHLCNKNTPSRSALQMHINNHHSAPLSTCDICGKTGMSKAAFKHHSKKHIF